MTESQIQRSIISYLNKKYQEAVIFKHSDKTRCGIPDIQFICNGVVVWLEVKRPKGFRSKLQKWTIERLNLNGTRAFFVESLDDVKKIL